MSIAFHFHQRGQSQPLDEEFVGKQLAKEFSITGSELLENSSKLKYFCVTSPKYDLVGWEKEGGLCFVWQEFTEEGGGYYSVSGLHKMGERTDTNVGNIVNLLADVSKKLGLVIDDPQLSANDISPEKFIEGNYYPSKQQIREAKVSKIKNFWNGEVLNSTYWWVSPLRLPIEKSFLNNFITSVAVSSLILLTFATNQMIFIVPLIFVYLIFVGRGRGKVFFFAALNLWVLRFIWVIFNYNSPNFEQAWLYSENIAALLVFLYFIFYVFFNGMRWMYLKGPRNKFINEFHKLIYNKPEEAERVEALKVKFVTKEGLMLFVIAVILLMLAQPIKDLIVR